MRPLDPLLILLGTYAIQTLRAERKERAEQQVQLELEHELAPVA
jgi:hypothetical protein